MKGELALRDVKLVTMPRGSVATTLTEILVIVYPNPANYEHLEWANKENVCSLGGDG